MSYRDDVDAMFQRSNALERELQATQRRLADREAELAQLQGQPRPRADTSPGIRELRELPDPHEVLDRLIDRSGGRGNANLRPNPMPDWGHIVGSSTFGKAALVERVRENVAKLEGDDLTLVAKIVDELTDGQPGDDETLRKWLRWLAAELAKSAAAR